MDSPLHSSGFLNLLTSQNSQNSPTIDVEASEFPRFSSQSSEDQAKVERRKWTQKEDVVLISGWLNTSKDSIIGNEQKGVAFWKRIQEYFNGSPQVSDLPPREANHCKQRWGRINAEVCKFVGSYDAAWKEHASGENENDVMKAAHEIYYNDHQVKFTLEHAWRLLRYDQKWKTMCVAREGVKEKRKEAAEPEMEEVRPAGVKACKAAKRKKNANQVDLEKWETLFSARENISKYKVLECLLAKTETLSVEEVSLKMKLISDLT